MLYTAINRQDVLFLWPVRMADETGRLDAWNQSAHKAAQLAMEKWVRVSVDSVTDGSAAITNKGMIR